MGSLKNGTSPEIQILQERPKTYFGNNDQILEDLMFMSIF